jgi:hypothetical protein
MLQWYSCAMPVCLILCIVLRNMALVAVTLLHSISDFLQSLHLLYARKPWFLKLSTLTICLHWIPQLLSFLSEIIHWHTNKHYVLQHIFGKFNQLDISRHLKLTVVLVWNSSILHLQFCVKFEVVCYKQLSFVPNIWQYCYHHYVLM